MSEMRPIPPSWRRVTKTDPGARDLADRHYTRIRPGFRTFTRPGYNFVLLSPASDAVFVWWRPKWEDGRVGTQRFDKRRVLECTIFRNESDVMSSVLIRDAVTALSSTYAMHDLRLHEAGPIDILTTGVRSGVTASRRSSRAVAGQCFVHAGWSTTDRQTQRADAWLEFGWRNHHDGWRPR